jgi:hypothetical protein
MIYIWKLKQNETRRSIENQLEIEDLFFAFTTVSFIS